MYAVTSRYSWRNTNKSMSNYTSPNHVNSPKAHWTLIAVLEDRGEWDTSLAVGRWDDDPCLAIRWNGGKDNPVGNPQSRGLPTWFVLPKGPKTEAILLTLPTDKQKLARNFLPESGE